MQLPNLLLNRHPRPRFGFLSLPSSLHPRPALSTHPIIRPHCRSLPSRRLLLTDYRLSRYSVEDITALTS